MNVRTILVATAVLSLIGAGHASAQKLSLRVEQGLVTLEADNVTIDEILARWNSITGLNVVSKNGRGSDIPVTLRIAAMPERDALALVLRDLSGYIMGERRDPRTGLVSIDRVMILPDSAAQASAPPLPRVAPPPAPRPTFELGDQVLALPVSSDEAEPEPDAGDDDTPRELAPRPANPFAGSGSLGPTGGEPPSALAAPFAIAPLGVISDDSPVGVNSPTLAPGQTVAPQTPAAPPPPTPTKENPFAAPGAAQPGAIVPAPSDTPAGADSPTPSLRIQSTDAPQAPQ
jgi:hypothetical protein